MTITFLITGKRERGGTSRSVVSNCNRGRGEGGKGDSIAISTPWRTTETFPTPGDTIVLDDVARRRGGTFSLSRGEERDDLSRVANL